MPGIEKTVFISYRRTNVPWALAVYQNLTVHGYDVFFDYQNIDSGNFEKVILENIKARAHFLVILTPSALERCKEPGDWLRREIETAMDEKRNIVPLMLESFDFGSPLAREALDGKLASLNKFNGLRVYSEYFFEAMDKLRERYLNVILSDVTLPALQAEVRDITDIQKSTVSEAPQVEKEELTAQEWIERGSIYFRNNNINESIRCFSEAILLAPSDTFAYQNRGAAFGAKGDLDSALADFDKAIQLNPSFEGYSGRGITLELKGDFNSALSAFDQAFRLNPDDVVSHLGRGNVLKNLKRYDEAETEYREAIKLNPKFSIAYNALCILLRIVGRAKEAIPFYQKWIEINPDDFNSYLGIASIKKMLGEAIEMSFIEKARQFMPDDDSYNKACLESVCDNFNLAFEHLQRAAQKEKFNPTWAWEDPDLQWIRDDPRFVEIVGPKPEK